MKTYLKHRRRDLTEASNLSAQGPGKAKIAILLSSLSVLACACGAQSSTSTGGRPSPSLGPKATTTTTPPPSSAISGSGAAKNSNSNNAGSTTSGKSSGQTATSVPTTSVAINPVAINPVATGPVATGPPPSSTKTSVPFQLGKTQNLPSGARFGSVTAFSFEQGITRSTSATPRPGTHFASALVGICAPANASTSPNIFDFSATLSNGAILAPAYRDAMIPGLDNVTRLAPGQCGKGYLTFEVPNGLSVIDLAFTLTSAYPKVLWSAS